MLGFGKVACVLCNQRVPPKEALRGRDWKDVTVCKVCYAKWEHTGRTCGQCKTEVHGPQEVGAFIGSPIRGFGHADCGGIRFAR